MLSGKYILCHLQQMFIMPTNNMVKDGIQYTTWKKKQQLLQV